MDKARWSNLGEAHLFAIMLKLRPVARADVLPNAGQQAHAALLAWLAEVDSALATRLHAPNVERPFTCSSLWFPNPRLVDDALPANQRLLVSPEQVYWLRLTLLNDELFQALTRRYLLPQMTAPGAMSALPRLRLGSAHFDVVELVAMDDHPDTRASVSWAGFASYADLVAQARAVTPAESRSVGLEFRSPTAFSDGQRSWGKRMHLFPDPERVFDRLAKVWNTFAPDDLALDHVALHAYATECMAVARFTIETRFMRFDRHHQIGFVGSCVYDLFEPAADAVTHPNGLTSPQAVRLLARFAFFAGIGQKTAMGMGQARPLLPRVAVAAPEAAAHTVGAVR